MEAVIGECEKLGFRQMVAVIGDGQGNNASVEFHRKLGFQHSGVLQGSGYKFGRWLDTVLMQHALNEGADGALDTES